MNKYAEAVIVYSVITFAVFSGLLLHDLLWNTWFAIEYDELFMFGD